MHYLFVEKEEEKIRSLPGPGQYRVDEVTKSIGEQHISKRKTEAKCVFGKQERFKVPTWKYERAPGPIYNIDSPKIWRQQSLVSPIKNTGRVVIGLEQRNMVSPQEKALVPGPGTYKAMFSEFSGSR